MDGAGIPYQAAKCHWWHALAELRGIGGRDAAREPLHAAWRLASRLPPGRCALRSWTSHPLPAGPPHRRRASGSSSSRRPRPQDTRRVALPAWRAGGAGARGLAELVRPPGVPEQPFGLSPRELEVLLILAEGRTDREIAERLFISQRTVHIHVRRVLAKLGATSRTQATSIAWRAGVLPTSPANPGVR